MTAGEKLEDWELEVLLKLLQAVCKVIVNHIPEGNATDVHEFCHFILAIVIPGNETRHEVVDISVESKNVLTVLYCAVITFALVGNIGVIVVFAKNKSFRGAVTIPILSLAISDLLVTVVCMPFTLANILNRTMDYGTFSEFICKVVPYMQTTALVANTLTLGCIAFERYIAVIYPLKSRSYQSTTRTLVILGSIWIVGVSLSIPNLLWFSLVQVNNLVIPEEWNNMYMLYDQSYCMPAGDNKWPMIAYRFVILVCVFGMPFIAMSFAYTQISYHLSNRKSPGNSSCQSEVIHVRTSRRVITMLVVVQLLFFICWTPYLLFEVIGPVVDMQLTETLLNVKYYLYWFAASNSCHNPLVYTFLHEKFRKNFASICCCLKAKSKVEPTESAISKTPSASLKQTTDDSNVNVGQDGKLHLYNNNTGQPTNEKELTKTKDS